MDKSETSSHCLGKTLGEIVAQKIEKSGQEMDRLRKEARSQAFQTVGELLQDFLTGKIKFVSTGKVTVSGDPAKILELCQKNGLSFHELNLKGKSLEEILAATNELIADVSYLLLKGAIVPEPVGYVPPDYQGIASIIDMKEFSRKFPDLWKWLAPGAKPGEKPVLAFAIVPIIAVDVVVVVLDVYVIAKDKPIDLITRE